MVSKPTLVAIILFKQKEDAEQSARFWKNKVLENFWSHRSPKNFTDMELRRKQIAVMLRILPDNSK